MVAGTTELSHVRVRREVLLRLESRRGGSDLVESVSAHGCEPPLLPPDVKAPVSWLQRLGGERTAPPLSVCNSDTLCADGRATASWLAKIRVENRFHEVSRRAMEHSCPSARARHNALRRARAPQELQAHCHASVEFLRGPRQLRDRFGSVIDGTDRTADVALAETADLRSAMMADVSDLCRRARETRFEGADQFRQSEDPPRSESETLAYTRAAADAALKESERVLASGVLQDGVVTLEIVSGLGEFMSPGMGSRARLKQLLASGTESSDGESAPPSPGVRDRAEEALQESNRLLAVFNARTRAQDVPKI